MGWGTTQSGSYGGPLGPGLLRGVGLRLEGATLSQVREGEEDQRHIFVGGGGI